MAQKVRLWRMSIVVLAVVFMSAGSSAIFTRQPTRPYCRGHPDQQQCIPGKGHCPGMAGYPGRKRLGSTAVAGGARRHRLDTRAKISV